MLSLGNCNYFVPLDYSFDDINFILCLLPLCHLHRQQPESGKRYNIYVITLPSPSLHMNLNYFHLFCIGIQEIRVFDHWHSDPHSRGEPARAPMPASPVPENDLPLVPPGIGQASFCQTTDRVSCPMFPVQQISGGLRLARLKLTLGSDGFSRCWNVILL